MRLNLKSASAALLRLFPGLALSLLLAGGAIGLGAVSGWPGALIALMMGFVAGRFLRVGFLQPGLTASKHMLLKFGILLLGANIPIESVLALRGPVLFLLPCFVMVTILTGLVMARLLSRDSAFGFLAGGAVAICGASAALAIHAGLPHERRNEQHLAFCILAATILSTAAMFAYPLLLTLLRYDPLPAGGVIGASIHDVAQVVGAGFSLSPEAGEMAVLIKMCRVLCLPAVVIAAGFFFRSASAPSGGVAVMPPWFITGFFVMLALNSLHVIPYADALQPLASLLLLAAIAALASQTDVFSARRPVLADWAMMIVPSLVLLVLAVTSFRLGVLQ